MRKLVNNDVRVLGQVPLLAGLPESELQHLADTLRLRHFPTGEVVIEEGDQGDCFYIVRTGQVEIVKNLGQPGEQKLAVRGPGDFIGEMSLFNRDGLRTASVRALEAVDLWELSQQEFDDLLHRQPLLAYEMVRVLSARLSVAHNNAVRNLLAKNRQLSEAYEALKAAQAQIIEKERLERELEVAHEIQMSILPSELPKMDGFSFGARLLPARSVGGDFYGFVPLDEDRLGIMIGDVTDKGVPAAIFMAQVHAYITSEAERDETPGQVLRRVNRRLLEKSENGLFVTVLYGVLDRRLHQFRYARAGHELPILHLVDQEANHTELIPGQPLGLFDELLLDEQTIELPPDSTVLLYTDGVTDQQNPGGDLFGSRRLLESVNESTGLAAPDLCDKLLSRIQDFYRGAPQFDDLTLLAIQASPSA